MHATRCPACGNTAMGLRGKLTARRLVCSHCRRRLRLCQGPSMALALAVLVAIMAVAARRGIDATSILFTLACLLAFVLACIVIPLEAVDQRSPTKHRR